MRIAGYNIPMMASLLIWAVAWEVIGRAGVSFILPPLSAVLVKMVEIVPQANFLIALGITARCFLWGVGLAIVIGVPLGVLMGRSVILDRLVLPWVNMFISAPLSALVPVLMVLFGFGEETVIITTFLFAVWIIILNARAGVMQISPSLVEMARSFGATGWQAFSSIYVWAALPEILAGVRIGVIRGVKGVIVGQLLVSVVGFGKLFEIYSSNFLMLHFWALLLVLFFFAFLFAEGLAWAERKVEYYAANRA